MTPSNLRTWVWSKTFARLGDGKRVRTARGRISRSFVRVAHIGRTRGLRRGVYAPPPFVPAWRGRLAPSFSSYGGGLWNTLRRVRYRCEYLQNSHER